MNKKMPKIQDVARVAGVSTATVSRTLSSPDVVSAKTRDSVLAAVKATGYRVNRAARNLRTQRTGAILALVPNLGNPFFSEILQGMERTCKQSDYNLLIADTSETTPDADQLEGYFRDGQADGLIILDGSLPRDALENLQNQPSTYPSIFMCEWNPETNFHSVRSDNAHGMKMAVKHLADQGHTDIGHVRGPMTNVLSHAREGGFRKAMEALNLPVNENFVLDGDFTLEAGRMAGQELLRMDKRPTAMVCASDQIAFGLIAVLSQNNVTVPDDISVLGFDDVEMAEFFYPPLTTIRQDRDCLGRSAAKLLLERLKSRDMSEGATVTTIPVEMVVRSSTSAPAN